MWKQKDGSLIAVSKMTDSHIKNCIGLLRRYEARMILNIGEMASFHSNGEEASYALDSAFDDALENGYNEAANRWIDIFTDELEKREAKK